MTATKKIFYAYPSNPDALRQPIEKAATDIQAANSLVEVTTWPEMDIFGNFIAREVLKNIDECDILAADITRLNCNVTFEIGFAIGRGKPVKITKNQAIREESPSIREVGIFDTIGYAEYQNSKDLAGHLTASLDGKPIETNYPVDTKAPVYLVDTAHKTDWETRIVSRIKKSKYIFRNFDPTESPRLAASDAITNVAKSFGVVVPLLGSQYVGHEVHNIRCSFVAGLAMGMNKALCILQNGDDPVPIDYRDLVRSTKHPGDVDEHIAELAGEIAEAFQQNRGGEKPPSDSFLQRLDLGASSAENEMRSLERYYLKSDPFLRSARGEAHIVVGRKGSGKSAIFLQIRDRERRSARNIVLDLKPDGYKLLKFKEQILQFLKQGTFQHTITMFWEYILLLEITYKILEADRQRHVIDHEIFEPYRKLADRYHAEGYKTDGDFSERMSALMERISTAYRSKHGDSTKVSLSQAELTELLYVHDVSHLRNEVAEYMSNKETLWLLFDNIDKGWPSSGLQKEDLIIIRSLLDATQKVERLLDAKGVETHSIVFLRNDVYDLLIRETSDRGKEANILVDWVDQDLLREIIRLRIIDNGLERKRGFQDIWPLICASHIRGEESSQFLIDRSLMRPRFLINLINQCKSFAINLNHDVIEEDDITKGMAAYSTDLLADVGYEISDILPEAHDVLYAFISSSPMLTKLDALDVIRQFIEDKEKAESVFDLLLWYGFFGIEMGSDEYKYIYNVNYSMQLLNGIARKSGASAKYVINPSFWPGLMIERNDKH